MDELVTHIQQLSILLNQHFSAEWMMAAGAGALAGLLRARLLVFALLAVGGFGTWMILAQVPKTSIAPEVLLILALLMVIGVLESVIVLVGGRDAVPQFWGAVFAALLGLILLFPLRAIRFGTTLLPGGRALKALFLVTRR